MKLDKMMMFEMLEQGLTEIEKKELVYMMLEGMDRNDWWEIHCETEDMISKDVARLGLTFEQWKSDEDILDETEEASCEQPDDRWMDPRIDEAVEENWFNNKNKVRI